MFASMENYEEMDGDLDTIKLKNLNIQGKNDPEAYLELEKKVDWILIAITILNKRRWIGDNWVYGVYIDLMGSNCNQ